MRDLDDYQKEYRLHAFERTMASYRRRHVLGFLDGRVQGSILEVGCGDAPIFSDVDESRRVVVVEPGASFYEGARQLAKGRSSVQLVHARIEDCVDKIGGPFDSILASSILHEVEQPGLMLDALRSVSSSGTVTHVNVPNARSFHRLLALEMGLISDLFERSETQKRLQQPHTFDLNSLRELVEKHGFEVLESGSFFVKPLTHAQMMDALEQEIVTEQVLDGLDRMIRHLPDMGAEIFVNLRLRGA